MVDSKRPALAGHGGKKKEEKPVLTTGQKSSISPSSSSSLLSQVWPKLRLFQREAFEFATQGKRHDRQWKSQEEEASSSGTTAINGSSSRKTAKIQNPYDTGGTDTLLDPSLIGQGRLLVADEMGLGKTVTSLAIMAHYEQEWPLLILCPASLRYAWPAEIEKFFPSLPAKSIYVVAGFQDVGFTKRPDVKVVICTYSLLQKRSAVAQVFAESASSNKPLFQCIIADESHNLKNKSSQRTALILPVLQKARRLLLLSGTPALASPVELWTQLFVLAPKLFGNFSSFTKAYCNPQRKQIGRNRFITEYKGSCNEAELHAKLRQVMVRRLKSSVLTELPAKQRSIVPAVVVNGKEKDEAKQAMQELSGSGSSAGASNTSSNLERLLEQELAGPAHYQQQQQGRFNNSNSNNDFEKRSKIMRAFQTTGIAKAKAVVDYLLDWLAGSSPNQKILVFAHHKQVMDTMEEALLKTTTSLSKSSSSNRNANRARNSQQQHIRIDGAVPTSVRAQLVRKFQTSPAVRVGLLSMTAAGVGLTLTAASTVLFAELHWTPGTLAQAEDRAHRIGQQAQSVNILYAVCKDETVSLDMAMWKLLGRKIGTLGQVVDGTKEQPYLYKAQEQEQQEGDENRVSRGTSAQEELTAFFADASATEAKRKKSPPAKGSIQNFFKPKGPSTAKSSVKPTPSSSLSSASFAGNKKGTTRRTSFSLSDSLVGNSSAASAATPAAALSAKNSQTFRQSTSLHGGNSIILWTCKTCTFENEKDKNSSGWYPCEMCSEPHVPEADEDCDDVQSSADNTTAHGFAKSTRCSGRAVSQKILSLSTSQVGLRTLSWSCGICTFNNKKDRNSSNWYPCEMCSEPHIPDNGLYDDDDDESSVESDGADLLASTPADSCHQNGMATTTNSFRNHSSTATSRKRSAPAARVSNESTATGHDVILLGSCSSKSDDRRDLKDSKPTKSGSSPIEAIEIDNTPPKANQMRTKKDVPVEMILLDDDDDDDDDESTSSSDSELVVTQKSCKRTKPPPAQVQPKKRHELEFSISKNSGRITVFYADSRVSSLVNFDVEQVLAPETCDALVETKANRVKRPRSGSSSTTPTICFDPAGVDAILQRVKRSTDDSVESFREELKLFVTSYLSFREVEKKALKESGESFAAFGLSQSVALIMSQALVANASNTERYCGGAKERAIENQKNGIATQEDEAVLKGRACAWCSSNLSQAQRTAKATYCSQECAEEGRLKRGAKFASSAIRSAMFALEQGTCQLCGISAHGFFEQIMALEPAERLNRYQSAKWRMPTSNKAYQALLNDPKEGDFWQVDHINPVAEGGGSCGLENLRTLCVPCHREETARLRVRLKLRSPSKPKDQTGGDASSSTSANTKNKRKQVDIRTAFFGASALQKRTKQSSIKTSKK